MDSFLLARLTEWLDGYIKGFYREDGPLQSNILLKEGHIHRVRENMATLAGDLGLGMPESALGEAVALLHDVGRFPQIEAYGTYNDAASVDHAILGVLIVRREGLLSSLPKDERRRICQAIALHNRYSLPPRSAKKRLIRMVRDADKLDILRIVSAHHVGEGQNPALDLGLPHLPGYTPKLLKDVLEGRMARMVDAASVNDLKLLYLSWIWDINYPSTIARIEKEGYMEAIMGELPITAKIDRLRHTVRLRLSSSSPSR